jgi:hypothetical protein
MFDFDAWLKEGEVDPEKPNWTHHPKFTKVLGLSPKRFAWMPDMERRRFEDSMIYPEVEED